MPSSGWNEKLNLTFASGDLPDAIIGGVDVVSNTDVLAPLVGPSPPLQGGCELG